MLGKIRKFISTLRVIGLVGVVLGILILLNYTLSFFPLRFDLTDNKIYSLSPASKNILKELDDIVTIKLFLSKELPNRVLPIRQEVESLLVEYERVGGGNIRVGTIVPASPAEEQEALSLGIPQLQFSGIEKDKLEVSQGFFGGVVQYGGENVPIPVFEEGANFEYQFTSAINRLTRKEVPVVALTTGHGEAAEELQLARELLRQEFEVRTQNISTASAEQVEIDEEVKTLLIVGAEERWENGEKEAVQDFVADGGSVLLAVEGVDVAENLFASEADHNLFDLFSEYGLELNNDLVLSASNDVANFRTQQSIYITQYPFWVRIRPEGVNQQIAAIAQLETAVFPWVSSIDVGKDAFALLTTVPQSYAISENFNLAPDQELDFKTVTGEKVVAAAAEIKAEPLNNSQGSALKSGRVVLIGDSDFVADNFLQRVRENAVLFLNLVDWLTSDSALAAIRARESSFRPLTELNDTAQAGVKYGAVLVFPVLLGIVGFLRLKRRS